MGIVFQKHKLNEHQFSSRPDVPFSVQRPTRWVFPPRPFSRALSSTFENRYFDARKLIVSAADSRLEEANDSAETGVSFARECWTSKRANCSTRKSQTAAIRGTRRSARCPTDQVSVLGIGDGRREHGSATRGASAAL